MHTFFYSFDMKDLDNAHEFEFKYAIKIDEDSDIDTYAMEDLAEAAADDFVDEHGGWECTDWPYEFYFWDADKNYLGKVSVECELIPRYYGNFIHED